MMIKKICVNILLLFICSSVCFAQTVYLKSGKKIKGKIIEQTDTYIKVDFYGTPIVCFMEDIDQIKDESRVEDIKHVEGQSAIIQDAGKIAGEGIAKKEPIREGINSNSDYVVLKVKIEQINAKLYQLQQSHQSLYFEESVQHGEAEPFLSKVYRRGKYVVDEYKTRVGSSFFVDESLKGGSIFLYPPEEDFKIIQLEKEGYYDGRGVWITEILNNKEINKYIFDKETGLCLLREITNQDGKVTFKETRTGLKLNIQEYDKFITEIINRITEERKNSEKEFKVMDAVSDCIRFGSWLFFSLAFSVIYLMTTRTINKRLRFKLLIFTFLVIWFAATVVLLEVVTRGFYSMILAAIYSPILSILGTSFQGKFSSLLIDEFMQCLIHAIPFGILGLILLWTLGKFINRKKTATE